MKPGFRFFLLLFLLALAPLRASPAEKAPDAGVDDAEAKAEREKEKNTVEPKLREEIEKLVKELGSAEWTARDKAHKRLGEISEPAIPFLEEACEGDDPEIKVRAKDLLSEVKGAGWLGIEISDGSRKVTESGKETEVKGAEALRLLVGCAAERDGLVSGDLIIKVGKKDTPDSAALIDAVTKLRPKKPVKLLLVRGGEKIEKTVKPDKRPTDEEIAKIRDKTYGKEAPGEQ